MKRAPKIIAEITEHGIDCLTVRTAVGDRASGLALLAKALPGLQALASAARR